MAATQWAIQDSHLGTRSAGGLGGTDGRPNPLRQRVRQIWNGVVGTVMLPPELLWIVIDAE